MELLNLYKMKTTKKAVAKKPLPKAQTGKNVKGKSAPGVSWVKEGVANNIKKDKENDAYGKKNDPYRYAIDKFLFGKYLDRSGARVTPFKKGGATKPIMKAGGMKKSLLKANNGITVPAGTRVSDGRVWDGKGNYTSDAETLRIQQQQNPSKPTGVPTGTVVKDGRVWNNETKSYSPAPVMQKRGGAVKKKMALGGKTTAYKKTLKKAKDGTSVKAGPLTEKDAQMLSTSPLYKDTNKAYSYFSSGMQPTPSGYRVTPQGRMDDKEKEIRSSANFKKGGVTKKKMTKTSLTKKRGGGKVATVSTDKLYKSK
jgi:hypothetical protein